ncbi:RNA-binding S4 domain-containing protein [Marinibactrum halimedae]|uniref:Heat shock protein 15 n=1 Tax=Marinibactrum halimedae TaxID=1444977 RepID=A0AA37T797_9GAMM|nr:S4 domain-containing protein [Marinibactrum halimedae]MCD9460471.1 RNA-binding protein [Marinibactrum halimedae]GLS25877.1 heat shock protein 15 [Marinibactrum halimedae]
MEKVRIDKWLWAARFFKTRSLAKQAIEGGKIRCEGQRVKASKDLMVGLTLSIQKGWDTWEVEVIALSDQRRGAPEAQLLYNETPESIEKREKTVAERRASGVSGIVHDHRPSKKERRQIIRFREQDLE